MTKKLIILSFLMIPANSLHAQADVKVWTRLVGSGSYDLAYAVAADSSGNCIIAGATQGTVAGTSAGRYDMFVGKYDANGNRLWLNQRGTDEREFAYGVATDASGNVYVTGYTGNGLDGNSGYGGWDIFLMKFGPTGNWLWTKQDGTGQDDEGRAVTTDASGNIYVTGYVRGVFHGLTRVGSSDVFISKYNSAGTRLWSALFGSTAVDESFGITCDASGNVFVTGWTLGSIEGNTDRGNGDNFLVKYDTNGQRQWLRQWGTVHKDTAYAVACDATGNVYVSGYTVGTLYGPACGNRDAFLAKYDASGNFLWGKQPGTAEHDQGWGVATDATGNVYLAGETGGSLDGNEFQGGLDIFLTKYDPTGTTLWTQEVGTTGDDWADGVAIGPNGVVFLGGTTEGSLDGNTNQGLQDAFAMKFVPAANMPPAPTGALANPATICSGGCAQLSATPGSGGNTVDWFTTSCGGTPVTGGASPSVCPTETTTYYARTRNTTTGYISTTCASVQVSVSQPPTPASVGGPQLVPSHQTTSGLGGNTPAAGTGTWSVFSGGTGTFNPNNTTPNATFTHSGGVGPFVLRWTISNPPCTATSSADLTVTLTVASDLDRDGDVGQVDYGLFHTCFSGPAVPYDVTPTCQSADLDQDNDVDQDDFGIFQRCYTGENNPVDLNCPI